MTRRLRNGLGQFALLTLAAGCSHQLRPRQASPDQPPAWSSTTSPAPCDFAVLAENRNLDASAESTAAEDCWAHLVLHGAACQDFEAAPAVDAGLRVSVDQTCLLGGVEFKQMFRVLLHVGNAGEGELELQHGALVDATGADFGEWLVEEERLRPTQATSGMVMAMFDFGAEIPPRPWSIRLATTDGRRVSIPGTAF